MGVKGQLNQPHVFPEGTDSPQILQFPNPAQGLEKGGILRGEAALLQLLLEKDAGFFDGGAQGHQDAQGLGIGPLRLSRVFLHLAYRQGNAGKSSLKPR